MGHKRKNPTPSPLRMLSIFHAREQGVGLPEIAERTGHSISSIMRWTDKHGDEGKFFEKMLEEFPNLEERIGFDSFYPKGGNPVAATENDHADDIEDDDEQEDEKKVTSIFPVESGQAGDE